MTVGIVQIMKCLIAINIYDLLKPLNGHPVLFKTACDLNPVEVEVKIGVFFKVRLQENLI